MNVETNAWSDGLIVGFLVGALAGVASSVLGLTYLVWRLLNRDRR